MMSESALYSVYRRLPISLQNASCGFYGWKQARARFGAEFEQAFDQLLSSEWATSCQVRSHQDRQVEELVAYAYQKVPHYRRVMQRRNLTPKDIRTVGDLSKLPILTKEDLRAAPESFRAEGVSLKELEFRHTSGTTGKALQFYVHRRATPFQWAVWWRHRSRFGLRLGDHHANFTGKVIVPPEQRQPPYWRKAGPLHQTVVPMQHITPDKCAAIVDMLNAERFMFFSGYPSVIDALAGMALEQGLRLLPGSVPRVVVAGAENFLATQRRHINEWTGAVVTDQYGFTEACGNASPCLAGRYHEDYEFGVLECVPEGQEVAEGTNGRVVCTGFLSKEFPLIRYDIGDFAVWDEPENHCPCGRKSRTIKAVDGRVDDYVVTPEGHRVMRFDYLFKDAVHVRECQVVQTKPGSVTFKIVRRDGYSTTDEATIVAMVREYISPTIDVDFEYVSELARSRSGKLRAVVSQLPHSTDVRPVDEATR